MSNAAGAGLNQRARAIAAGARRAAHALLPQRCALCAARTGLALICDACAGELPRTPSSCPVCALPTPDGGVCGACLRKPPAFRATRAAFVYAFPVDRLVQALKYRGSLALAQPLGLALAEAVLQCAERTPCDAVLALPLAPSRQRERGFNQAREIARHVARAVGTPLAGGLRRADGGLPQVALPLDRRASNVRGAFACDSRCDGASIAIVDDVMTTGATLDAAAKALLAAGAVRVEAWVVARTPPPRGEA